MAGQYAPSLMGDAAIAWRKHSERLEKVLTDTAATLRVADGKRRTWHTAEADIIMQMVQSSHRALESALEDSVEHHGRRYGGEG